MIAEIAIAALIAATPAPADHYTTTARVTEYCPACNSPAGHGSASGVYLTAGHCACGWLPMGAVVEIDGARYEVVDTCGTDAIDIFIDDNSGACVCDRNEVEEVTVFIP